MDVQATTDIGASEAKRPFAAAPCYAPCAANRESEGVGGVRGYACIGLHDPKWEKNIGAVLRACGCYEANMIVVAGKRYHHAPTDTQKTWKHIPLLEVESLQRAMPKGCVAVAVDLVEGARPLTTYVHPERAFYVFGGEDRTLGPDVLSWCRDVVYVPTAHCMNLAATVNVILYDRLAKRAFRISGGGGFSPSNPGRNLPLKLKTL